MIFLPDNDYWESPTRPGRWRVDRKTYIIYDDISNVELVKFENFTHVYNFLSENDFMKMSIKSDPLRSFDDLLKDL